jgi:hypothetical protein
MTTKQHLNCVNWFPWRRSLQGLRCTDIQIMKYGQGHSCGNETKVAYGSSPVEFGGGLWLPGGIVIAIAPTVPFAELLEQQNEERIMRVYEDHRIGGAACRVLTDDPGSLRFPAHIPRNRAAVDRLQ